ncbi:TonB-dependent receptor [candidate division KSB1 bacterium]|nr:TonB-dependent receptor [candidate division KSB1 bacterium]
MKRNFLAFLLVALLVPALLLAGTTGKIKGKVTDRESGEPLPGANVLILGTTFGAASDFNGEFVILNVPPGLYTVKSTFIGYQEVSILNIRVNADLTTEANFKMPTTAVEVGEVSIVAERPLVNKNATNAVRIQSAEDIQNLPVRGVGAAIALQPGIVVQNGLLYIRGGRNDEVGFYLEGASARDANTGSNAVTVIPEALEELQIQAGGFNAEFGGANAGIIRQTLKSGSREYHFSFQGETDNLVKAGNQFLDTYSYGHTDYTMTFSGPVPKTNNKLRFFMAGQNVFDRDRIAQFWEGFDFNHAPAYVDGHNFPLVFTTISGTPLEAFVQQQGLHMRDGIIPAAARNLWIGNGTLVFDANPFIVRLGGSFSFQRQDGIGGFPNYVANMFNRDRTRVDDLSTGLVNLKFTHLLGTRSFYEINLNYFDRRQAVYDPIFKHNIWAYWDSVASAEKGITFFSWEEPTLWRGGNSFDIHGFDFFAPGAPSGGQGLSGFGGVAYGKNKRGYFGGSLAFTTQYRAHEVKLGASYERWTSRSFGAVPRTLLTSARVSPDILRGAWAGNPSDLLAFASKAGTQQRFTYGYDAFGNETNNEGPDGPRHPAYFSGYLQDRFEISDLVINAGLRLDVIDNDDFVFADPSNPPWDRTNHGLLVDQLVEKKAEVEFSPRLGLAFPVTDRTVFHLQYGKFVQAPAFGNIYNGSTWYDGLFAGGTSFQASLVGLGLKPEKTIQYEIGFNQQFADNAAFDVTLFYKNIAGQLQAAKIRTDPTSPAFAYNVLVNGDFATTSGMELSLTLRRTNRVSAQLNYTFSRSLGTGSVNNSAIAGIELGQELPTVISPLDFHRPHRGSINFDYRFGKGDGGRLLERTGLNLLFTFTSGHPYTLAKGDFGQQDASFAGEITDPRAREPMENVNASLTPWNTQLNLRLDRTVALGPVETNIYFYVQNLTNRMNAINVYDRTGNPFNDGFLDNAALSGGIVQANGGPAYEALHRAINLNGNGTNYSRNTGLALLGQPRTVRVGARIQF